MGGSIYSGLKAASENKDLRMSQLETDQMENGGPERGSPSLGSWSRLGPGRKQLLVTVFQGWTRVMVPCCWWEKQ